MPLRMMSGKRDNGRFRSLDPADSPGLDASCVECAFDVIR